MLLTGSKLTNVFQVTFSAVQGGLLCRFLIYTASHEVQGLAELLFPDEAPSFRRDSFLGLNVLVTVFQ